MKWTTPQWIRALAAGSALAAVVLAVVLGTVFATVRDGLSVIGGRAAPQVTAATDLYFALSDMDAQLANVLLAGDDTSLAPQRKSALDAYSQRRTQADADLQQIATDSSTQKSVRSVLDDLGQYESLASQAILLDQHGAAGRPAATALDLHRQATDLMHTTLRTVDGITSQNHDLLNATYQSDVDGTVTARVWVIVIGVATLGLLVAAQVHLRRRMRRRLNPALVLATLVTAGVTITGVTLLAQESAHLTVAKANAFDSIVALSQARAVSYDANADESRYLVDPARAARYQDAFLAKTQSLAGLSGATITSYDAALDAATQAYRENNSTVRFTGFFGTELNNITFTGERGAAEQTLAAYQTYERDDRHIRALNAAGDQRGAITFDVGQSNADFGRYDAALKTVIDINQRSFDAAIRDGDGQLAGWTWQLPALGALLVVGLTAAGVWRRLAEYR